MKYLVLVYAVKLFYINVRALYFLIFFQTERLASKYNLVANV